MTAARTCTPCAGPSSVGWSRSPRTPACTSGSHPVPRGLPQPRRRSRPRLRREPCRGGKVRPSVAMRIGQIRLATPPRHRLHAAARAEPGRCPRARTGGRHAGTNARTRRSALNVAVELSHRDAGLVVTVHDADELPALERLAGLLAEGARVVVDVSAVTVAPADDARTLVDGVRAAALASSGLRWSLVATRLSARRVLRQLCAGSSVDVFASVDAALGPAVRR